MCKRNQCLQLVQNNEVPPAIDLSCYNVGAVRTLTDFLAGIDARNLRLGASILPDLLQLARIFRMHELTDLIAKVPVNASLLVYHIIINFFKLVLQNKKLKCMAGESWV